MTASLPSVLCYLALRSAGRPVLPLDPTTPTAALADLVDRFAPAALITTEAPGAGAVFGTAPGYFRARLGGWGECLVRQRVAAPYQPDLGLLLATSGSTGAPKLVRLATTAAWANARAVVAALDIGPADVAITALPLHYSYGLSVLTSHLLAGATVVCATGNVTAPLFWQAVERWQVSTLSLVPSQYEMLAQMRWRPLRYPALRVMTAAGGRLSDDLAISFHREMDQQHGRFYVMYGQTEAGPRICVLPPGRLPDKLGSAGSPVPGVRLRVTPSDSDRGAAPGEVICAGPGVMMGYAEHADDLAAPDLLRGVLHTGDLGTLDTDGYLWLSGRINRIGKVFGVRVHLDAVEGLLAPRAPTAAVAGGDRIRIWCEGVSPQSCPELLNLVVSSLRVHRSGIELRAVDRLPRLASGKTDYRALEQTP